MYQIVKEKLEVQTHLLKLCERFPNNDHLPLVIYKGFFDLEEEDGRGLIKDTFESNNWSNSWVDTVYPYHHYHSVTHEALGVAAGKAVLNFGGIAGVIIELCKGDVVMIPAGVAHKCLKHSEDFKCVGAYPLGKDYDILTGKPGERPQADINIKKVPVPETDPVMGPKGQLFKFWKRA